MRGATRTPSLGNVVKAEVCSARLISADPSASGSTGTSGEVMPNLRA